jgi:hypothetical protein
LQTLRDHSIVFDQQDSHAVQSYRMGARGEALDHRLDSW